MNHYQELVRQTVEEYIKNKKTIQVPGGLPEEFTDPKKRKGVFVTIHNGKDLRGCIGTYLPTQESLGQEIIQNAVSACSKDYRFKPITAEELPKLSYEVSLLKEPKKVEDFDQLNPKKYGVIVTCSDGRSGLLLPDLEGVNSVEDQLAIACQKGGIDPLRDEVSVYGFEVEKY